jgi:hypothetical protein
MAHHWMGLVEALSLRAGRLDRPKSISQLGRGSQRRRAVRSSAPLLGALPPSFGLSTRVANRLPNRHGDAPRRPQERFRGPPLPGARPREVCLQPGRTLPKLGVEGSNPFRRSRFPLWKASQRRFEVLVATPLEHRQRVVKLGVGGQGRGKWARYEIARALDPGRV